MAILADGGIGQRAAGRLKNLLLPSLEIAVDDAGPYGLLVFPFFICRKQAFKPVEKASQPWLLYPVLQPNNQLSVVFVKTG